MVGGILSALGIAQAFDENAEVPSPGLDLSVHRVDTDVWGFSKDAKEIAALGVEITRSAQGKQRNEFLLLVYRVGEFTPIRTMSLMITTQRAMPYDPLPLVDVRNSLSQIEVSLQNLWPKRLKKKYQAAYMQVTPLYEFVPLTSEESESASANPPGVAGQTSARKTLCQVSLGFKLNYHGQIRYQPHHLLNIRGQCAYLRYKDHRTYWLKPDLAATMIRFDSSPTKNEVSVRLPVSVAWSLARSPRISWHAPAGRAGGAREAEVVKLLKQYGTPIISREQALHVNKGQQLKAKSLKEQEHGVLKLKITSRENFAGLARHVAKELGAIWVPPAPEKTGGEVLPANVDILVVGVREEVRSSKVKILPQAEPGERRPEREPAPVNPAAADSVYLRDWP